MNNFSKVLEYIAVAAIVFVLYIVAFKPKPEIVTTVKHIRIVDTVIQIKEYVIYDTIYQDKIQLVNVDSDSIHTYVTNFTDSLYNIFITSKIKNNLLLSQSIKSSIFAPEKTITIIDSVTINNKINIKQSSINLGALIGVNSLQPQLSFKTKKDIIYTIGYNVNFQTLDRNIMIGASFPIIVY